MGSWSRPRAAARPSRPGAKTVGDVAKNHSAVPGPVLTLARDTVPGPVTCHAAVTQSVVTINAVELQIKVREDFTIMEKAPTRAFSWLKAPTIAFTSKKLLKQYAKWV